MNQHEGQERLRELLEDRMALGNELLEAAAAHAAAQEAVVEAERRYAAAHKAALAGGWTATELRKAGLRTPTGSGTRRPRRRTSAATNSEENQPPTTPAADTEQG